MNVILPLILTISLKKKDSKIKEFVIKRKNECIKFSFV